MTFPKASTLFQNQNQNKKKKKKCPKTISQINYVFPSQGQRKKKRKRKKVKSGFSPVGSLAKGREAYDLISKGYLTYFSLEFKKDKKKRGKPFLMLGKVPYGKINWRDDPIGSFFPGLNPFVVPWYISFSTHWK